MVAAHLKVAVQGTLLQSSGGGSETFSFGWADMSALTPAALAAIVDTEMSNDWESSTISLQISTNAIYTGVRVEQLDAAGKVTGSYFKAATTSVRGLNASVSCTIICQAVSLETGQRDAKGTLIRGRFYPPAASDSIIGATSGEAATQNYANNWGTALHNIKTAGGMPAVASSTSVGLVAVTGTSCDNVTDTQRRRKNGVTVWRSTIHAI